MKRDNVETTNQRVMTDYQSAENYIMEILKQKLPDSLRYHSYFHVMDVLSAAIIIAEDEKVNGDDLKLLRIAVLFHDSGFMNTTQNHEAEGCRIVSEVLPQFCFSAIQIEQICGMIMATKIPQSPKTQLEKIICDADLDYLGRDDFYAIGLKLFEEMKIYHRIKDEKHWNIIQMNFLKSHIYHTKWAHKFRDLRKQEHLNEIIKLVESY